MGDKAKWRITNGIVGKCPPFPVSMNSCPPDSSRVMSGTGRYMRSRTCEAPKSWSERKILGLFTPGTAAPIAASRLLTAQQLASASVRSSGSQLSRAPHRGGDSAGSRSAGVQSATPGESPFRLSCCSMQEAPGMGKAFARWFGCPNSGPGCWNSLYSVGAESHFPKLQTLDIMETTSSQGVQPHPSTPSSSTHGWASWQTRLGHRLGLIF